MPGDESPDQRVHMSELDAAIASLFAGVLDHLEERYADGGAISGLPTGFHELDQHLGGLQPGELTVVGGRPSMGKTSFLTGLAVNASASDRPTLLVSLETSRQAMAIRILSGEARVDATRLRSGRLIETDWPKLSHAIGRLGKAPLVVLSDPRRDIGEWAAVVREHRERAGLDLLLVDGLQLLTAQVEGNRHEEISIVMRELKLLARELEIPVVVTAPVSRSCEARVNKRPILTDLYDSGSVESIADVVLFLYRDEIYNWESSNRGIVEISAAKNRNGPTGLVELAFVGTYARLANMARP